MGQYIFPIEIWEPIFEVATSCAEEWEFGRLERSMTFWGRSPNTITQWEDVLRTRRSLIAVSRLFYQLTTPLLYQSFFAVTSRQVACFRWTLQTRPALGGYVKRLGLFTQLKPSVNAFYPHILTICPNTVFCDTFCDRELSLSDLRPSTSLRSLELGVTPEPKNVRRDPAFLHLFARILQVTPQLEHLGLYWLPYGVKMTNSQPFASIRLGSLRSLHLRVCTPKFGFPDETRPTAWLFFSLTLPRLEDLLIEGRDLAGDVLNRIPASWLRNIHQFYVTHDSFAKCSLKPNHFPLLRKFTLDFSLTRAFPGAKVHEKLPFIQLEEIELFYCATPINLEHDTGFGALHWVLRLCAAKAVTPRLRSISMDITDLEEERRLLSTKTVRKRLYDLQTIVDRIVARGIDVKGLGSSSLQPSLRKLIKNVETWVLEP